MTSDHKPENGYMIHCMLDMILPFGLQIYLNNLGMNIFSQVNTKVRHLELNSNLFFSVPENWRNSASRQISEGLQVEVKVTKDQKKQQLHPRNLT